MFSKIEGADYPDATMLVAALPLPDDGTTGVDILEQAQALFDAGCTATTLAVGACAKITFEQTKGEFSAIRGNTCSGSQHPNPMQGWGAALIITTG